MNFFTKFWMLFMFTILILCNERMCVDTWAFLPSKNTQHLCKCLHMALHQMPLMNVVVWWKPSPPNAWSVLSKQFTRFLNDGTCDNHNVLIWKNNLKSMWTIISLGCLCHWIICTTYGKIAPLFGKGSSHTRIKKIYYFKSNYWLVVVNMACLFWLLGCNTDLNVFDQYPLVANFLWGPRNDVNFIMNGMTYE